MDGRRCVICGVEIPSPFGPDGHSDADLAVHALMDAMLGAAALGDIGRHFPDTDDAYKGISSIELLRRVDALIKAGGYRLGNADITVIAQKPKMAPYIPDMIKTIAETLGVPENCINVKATTEEGLGFTGDLSGIAAHAVVLLETI